MLPVNNEEGRFSWIQSQVIILMFTVILEYWKFTKGKFYLLLLHAYSELRQIG